MTTFENEAEGNLAACKEDPKPSLKFCSDDAIVPHSLSSAAIAENLERPWDRAVQGAPPFRHCGMSSSLPGSWLGEENGGKGAPGGSWGLRGPAT